MSRDIRSADWWELPISQYPLALRIDHRAMEAARIGKLLTSSSEQDGNEDLWLRIRRAATLLETSTLEKGYSESSQRIWELVALMHEAIGITKPETSEYHWLLSSLCWQLAEATAIAELLSKRLMDSWTFSRRDVVEQIAIAFSQRRFKLLSSLSQQITSSGEELKSQFNSQGSTEAALEAGVLLSLGAVIRDLSDYVQSDREELPDLSPLTDFLVFLSNVGPSRRIRIGRLLAESIYRFSSLSSRMLIDEIGSLSDTEKTAIRKYLRRYAELWPSQRDAIGKGLLDRSIKHFVVSVPTSSGKTLCGELAIIQELSGPSYGTCFYVVPSRALVEEKSQELQRKLRDFNIKVAAATGALQRDEIEEGLFADAQVIVCTPEKLDLLVRHNDDSVTFASLFIIDEVQMISDGDRGLGLEFVVVKLLLLKPEARIILLSAMIPNSEEFGRWLSREAVVSSSSWRPTRQRYGEIVFRAREGKRTGCYMEVVLYDVAGVLEGIEGVNIRVNEYSRRPDTRVARVITAVQEFRLRGPVLVFCMTKPRCEEIVEHYIKHLKQESAQKPLISYSPSLAVQNLRRKIKRELAEDYLLSEALAFGVAYHHADLPPRIRVELEHLIANNMVEVVVSTTTLAEGVNLPISTVIFEDWMTRPDRRRGQRPRPLDLSKFRNIAGRAGRAGKEAEGLILFLDPESKPVTIEGVEQSPRDYFIRAVYPDIRSRFLEIIEENPIPSDSELDEVWNHSDLILDEKVRRALRQFGLAVLHAIEVLPEGNDELLIERVISHSLLSIQAPNKVERAREWFGKWVKFYRRLNLEREELRPLAMQIGLPLRAVQKLYARAMSRPDVLTIFAAKNSSSIAASTDQIEAATRIVAEIQELDWSPPGAPHAQLLATWMSGGTIKDLQPLITPYFEYRSRLVERTCNYCTHQLSNSGAWGMYAFARLLELIIGSDNISPVVKRLPLFVYFGVSTTPAALFSLKGIERIDAIRLGYAYLKNGNSEVSLSSLENWIKEIGLPGVLQIIRGTDERDIDRDTLISLGLSYP